MRLISVIAIVFSVFLTTFLAATRPMAAQDLSARLKQAETLAQQNKLTEALAALDEASSMLWDRAPLTFRKSLWVVSKPSGFSAYSVRENNVFPSAAPMIAYAEPVGFGWRRDGELWRTDLAVDIIVKDPSGKEIGRQENFGRLELVSRVRNREFMSDFTYTLRGLAAGNYQIETRMRDQVSGKTGSFTLPFTVK